MRDVEDSIDDDIRAAFAEATSGAPEAAAPQVQESPEPEQPKPSDEVSEGPVRDEKGRFSSKAEEQAEKPLAKPEEQVQAPQQPEVQAEPAHPAIQPPHSLTATVKALWSTLPPEAQQELARMDETVVKSRTEWSSKGERLNRFDELFKPLQDRLALAGTDEFRYIQGLMKADEMLRGPNASDALQQIGAMYGISFPAAQPAAEQQFDPGRPQQLDPASLQALLNPVVQPLVQRLEGIERNFNDRTTAEQDAERQRIAERVAAFQNETNADGSLKHLYFENVRPLMKTFIESGAAADLEDAYEMAIHADPTVRKLLSPATPPSPQPRPQAPTRPAGLSVTGPPSPGSQPNGGANSNSIEDDVRAAIREAAGAV